MFFYANRYKENLPSKAQIDVLIEEWNASYEDLTKRSPIVFCHLDVHYENIINSRTGQSLLFSSLSLSLNVCVDTYILIPHTPTHTPPAPHPHPHPHPHTHTQRDTQFKLFWNCAQRRAFLPRIQKLCFHIAGQS